MNLVESIKRTGLRPQEVLAVREGIKPMLRSGTNETGAEKIRNFCRENGLHCLITPFNPRHEARPEEQNYSVLISGSKETGKEYFEIEKTGYLGKKSNIIKAGQLLGYPGCCIDFYTRLKENMPRDNRISIPVRILDRSKNRPSFYLNNMFNFDSRAGGLARNKPIGINPFYFLISHVPCSYNCGKSIEYAKKVLGIVRKEDPEFAKDILHHTRRPVLFFDDFNWVVFDGKVRGSEIRYSKIIYHSLDSKELLEKLKSGNSVRADSRDTGRGVIFDFG